MTLSVLSRRLGNLQNASPKLNRLYHAGKATSVNSAIYKGLRKSNGMAFRGPKEREPGDLREKWRIANDIPEWKKPPKGEKAKKWPKTLDEYQSGGYAKQMGEGRGISRRQRDLGDRGLYGQERALGKDSGRSSKHDNPKRMNRDKLEREVRSGFESRRTHSGPSAWGDSEKSTRRSSYKSHQEEDTWKDSLTSGRNSYGGDDELAAKLRETSDTYSNNRKPRFNRESGFPKEQMVKRTMFAPKIEEDMTDKPLIKPYETGGPLIRYGTAVTPYGGGDRSNEGQFANLSRYQPLGSDQEEAQRRPSRSFPDGQSPRLSSSSEYDYGDSSSKSRYSKERPRDSRNSVNDTSTKPLIRLSGDRMPISLPYTTPASQFLYGTSVVEGALLSKRRKLYKLYIYTGENRNVSGNRDIELERMARRAGVVVEKVGPEFLRVMDKMSVGRPHNGYILEASPLPQLPVKSLGEVNPDGKSGFTVTLAHQSKEEAAINGTDPFVPLPKSKNGQYPLVLLLDSITDPGNMGGILRTACFLGVSAVAISSRNSSSFTPVVLKASAGASEDMNILMIPRPEGFIVDSKAAGWKVYAAVSPTKKHETGMPASLSTNDLRAPLHEAPTILMLGSEGEGLRWNLRSKADVDLWIAGHGNPDMVDSLNVSVAAGILVNAFLKPAHGPAPTHDMSKTAAVSSEEGSADEIKKEEYVARWEGQPERQEKALF